MKPSSLHRLPSSAIGRSLLFLAPLALPLPLYAQSTAEADTTLSASPAAASDVAPLDTIPVSPEAPAAAPPAAPAASGNVLLEEVIVTARKREEKLQDVPVSIAAFTSEQLDARGVTNIRDLGSTVPGLQITDLAGYNLIYLRGIGTDAFIPSADPSVATYIDGVYLPSAHSLGQSFGAVERVEVLKGPQGTLFGRNSTGGAVSVFTKDPDEVPEASAQASYGRFNDVRTRLHTNVPLTDELAISVSGFYNRAENYYKLVDQGNEALPDEIQQGARVKIGFYPIDDLKIVLTGLVQKQSGTSTTTSANTDPSALLGALIPAETRDFVVTADSAPSLTTQTKAAYGQATLSKPWFDTKLLGSYYHVNAYDYVYDFDGSALPLATYGADSDFQRVTTGELQFTSNASSWASDWLKWVGGFYYLNSRGGYKPGYLSLASSFLRLPTQQFLNLLPLQLGDVAREQLGGLIAPETLTFYFTGLIGAESYSAYAQTTVSITDYLDLTLGGRYQRETRELIRSTVGLENIGGGQSTVIGFAPRDSTVHNFSPKASLELRPFEDVLLYTSFQQGFKSATYNIINIYQQPDYVKPEKVTSYEVGLKTDWFDRTLRFNAAAFQSNIENLQTGFVSLTSGGAINFENAGKARIRGVELDSIWVPLREWNPGLTLTAGASWLDAIYTDYKNGSGYDEQTGLSFESNCTDPDSPACRDFSGNRIVRTPKFSGSFGISQIFQVPGGELEFAGDIYTNSGFYYLAQNSDNSFQDRYQVINARISYFIRDAGLRLTVFGANIGDERYDLAQFHTDFGREDTLAPPVTYGFRVNWDF